jgi:hypothetical protein
MRINSNRTVVNAQSLGASYTSQAIDVHRTKTVGLQAEVTGATGLTGTLAVLGRIGPNATFLPITAFPNASLTANGGFFLGFMADCPYDELQVVWTRTAGTGVLSVYMRTKEPGY